MSFNHPVSDLVARIKNGFRAGKTTISSPVSKLRESILKILKEEGYIVNYSKVKNDQNFEEFVISLKYYQDESVIGDIKVVSKPGKRIYKNSNEIPVVNNGLGTVIISTSQGVITDYDAREKNVGGEILLTVF